MHKCSIDQILDKIANKQPFKAVCDDYSFTIKIDRYAPYLAAAIHDGHQFSKDLWDNCLHTAYDRWYEEDPCTGAMIANLPITIVAHDSRFEYDLNRDPSEAIYDTAWGKMLWRDTLSRKRKQQALSKHHNFYKVTLALIAQLEQIHDAVICYDLHSYNWKRWDRPVPVFNIGTNNVDQVKYQIDIKQWQELLDQCKLPIDQKVNCHINDVFKGNGYFLKHITANTNNTLVLATEVSKIYCDEYTGVIYPEVVHAITQHLTTAVQQHANLYIDRHKIIT